MPEVTHAAATHTSRVEWMDTDAAGHHHNTAINRFVESVEAHLMRERGIESYFGRAPRVRFEVEYHARLWFGQQVTTTVAVERVGTTSMTLTFEVWGEAHDGRERECAATGRYVTVHLPPDASRAEPWPTDWVRALAVN